MDDIIDSRVREAMLPDHSGSNVACSNANMMSIDSGVETGNDSNDGSTVQQEGQQPAGQVISSGVPAVDSSGYPILSTRKEWSPFICDHSSKVLSMTMLQRQASIVRETQKLMQEKLLKHPRSYSLRKLSERMLLRKRMTHSSHAFSMADCVSEHTHRIQRKMRMAAMTNNTTLMRKLLEYGVPPNHHDEHGRTLLHISACRGYTEMVRLLLDHGADPNQRDCIGNTPLHLATVNNKLSVVIPLLTAGTDVLASDSYGYNPLQLARTRLRMLQRNCNNEDMLKVKEEMHNIINMLKAYLQKQKNMREQVKTLSNFYSRFSLSNTSDQVQDDVKDLLANINALSISG